MSGWLYYNPDAGTEWSLDHPIKSGQCPDATGVRRATAAALKDELVSTWRDAETPARPQTPFPTPEQIQAVATYLSEQKSPWLDWYRIASGVIAALDTVREHENARRATL